MLFITDEIKSDHSPIPAGEFSMVVDEPGATFLEGRAQEVIKKIAAGVKQNETIHFCTHGCFSMHELVEQLMTVSGPAKVYITTWAMTENPARAILQLMNDGLITELFCLFDYKIRERSPKAFQLAEGFMSKIKLTKCHAKVTLILNEQWGITILGSANYTRNPRTEAGIICTVKSASEFHRAWIEKEFTNGMDYREIS